MKILAGGIMRTHGSHIGMPSPAAPHPPRALFFPGGLLPVWCSDHRGMCRLNGSG